MAGKITLSVIKSDIGSIGGHICPSKFLLDTVKVFYTRQNAPGHLTAESPE